MSRAVVPKNVDDREILKVGTCYVGERFGEGKVSLRYIFHIFQTFSTLVIFTFYSLSTIFYATSLYDFPQIPMANFII